MFLLKTCNYNYGKNMKNEYRLLNMLKIPCKKSVYNHFKISRKDQLFIDSISK